MCEKLSDGVTWFDQAADLARLNALLYRFRCAKSAVKCERTVTAEPAIILPLLFPRTFVSFPSAFLVGHLKPDGLLQPQPELEPKPERVSRNPAVISLDLAAVTALLPFLSLGNSAIREALISPRPPLYSVCSSMKHSSKSGRPSFFASAFSLESLLALLAWP